MNEKIFKKVFTGFNNALHDGKEFKKSLDYWSYEFSEMAGISKEETRRILLTAYREAFYKR